MIRLSALVLASCSLPAASTGQGSLIGGLMQSVHAAIRVGVNIEAQKKRLRTALEHTDDIDDPRVLPYLLAGLLGESAELARVSIDARRLTDLDDIRPAIAAELGDVLWSLVALGEHFGIPFEAICEALATKMEARYAERLATGGYRPGPILRDQPVDGTTLARYVHITKQARP